MSALDAQPGEFLSINVVGTRFALRPRHLTLNRDEAGGPERFNIKGQVYYNHWQGVSPRLKDFCRDLPEASWDKRNECYATPITDSVALAIDHFWSRNALVFGTGAAMESFNKLLEDWDRGSGIAIQAAKFKADGTVPTLPANWQERADFPLSPYQKTAAKLALDAGNFALWMDRGTGKTATAIQIMNMVTIMHRDGEIECRGSMPRFLIVVPKNVRRNWQREMEKFSHVPGKVSVMRGSLHRRTRILGEMLAPSEDVQFSALIVGFDGVRTTEDYLRMVPWDAIIVDEAHNVKSSKTARWKSLIGLRDADSKRRIELTGSPIGNSPTDLWSQLEFLEEGASGFAYVKTFKEFHGEWAGNSKDHHGVEKLVGVKNIPFLQERLAKLSFSVSKEEAGLNLPDKVYSQREVYMTKRQSELYKELETQLAVEIEDKLTGEVVDSVTISNVLTMLLRLAQVTSGFITYDAQFDDDGEVVTPKRIVHFDENPKYGELLELLQDQRDPNAKTIIWCQFVENITGISDMLTAEGIPNVTYYGAIKDDARDEAVDAFNRNDEVKVFIGNPQTAGEGLNLLGYEPGENEGDTFCDMEVFFSNGWSNILRNQAEDRAHRRGTKMPVEIVDLVVPDTIDEEILDRLLMKKEMATTITDLRPTLARVLAHQ